MMVTGSKMAPGYHMKNAWLVALIFTMQAVLLGAAPICDCVEPTQAPPADGCCTDEGHTCCSARSQPDEPSEPATVATSPTVQLLAVPTDTARPAIAHSRPALLELTSQSRPTGLWSAFVRAERAPPLS